MKLNSQSTALNLFLINQYEKNEHSLRVDQKQITDVTGNKNIAHDSWLITNVQKKVSIKDEFPPVKVNTKWANTSINRNLKEFLKHNDLPDSRNPLNDHSLFEDAPVLSEGWITPNKKFYSNLSPRRQAPWENQIHFSKFHCILDAVGFDKDSPICLDRHGRLLDGAYRMYVMASLYEKSIGGAYKVYVKIYDFE